MAEKNKNELYNQNLSELIDSLNKMVSSDGKLSYPVKKAITDLLADERIGEKSLRVLKAIHDGRWTPPLNVETTARYEDGSEEKRSQTIAMKIYFDQKDGLYKAMSRVVDLNNTPSLDPQARYMKPEALEMISLYGFAGPVEEKTPKQGETPEKFIYEWSEELKGIFKMKASVLEKAADRKSVFGREMTDVMRSSIRGFLPFQVGRDVLIFSPVNGDIQRVTDPRVLEALSRGEIRSFVPGVAQSQSQEQEQKPRQEQEQKREEAPAQAEAQERTNKPRTSRHQ